MKKQLLTLLVLMMLPLLVDANGIQIDGIYYELNQEEKTAMVTFRDFNEGNTDAYTGTLNIPSTIKYNGEEFSVTSIGKEAFNYCYNLLSISIPSSITYIAGNTFEKTGWYNNQPNGIVYLDNWVINYKGEKPTGSITLTEGTRGIAELAFEGCENMTKITIPKSVKYIGARSFEGCSYLTSVTIPDGVTSIKGGTFLGCSSLTTIALPNSVTSIESTCAVAPWTYGAFRGCSSLNSVSLGENLKTIGADAFSGCTSLSSLSIPEKVTTIESYAFYECSNLSTITIPSSVASIGHYAFSGCNKLNSVHISDIGAWCKISFDYGEQNNPLSFAHHLYLGEEEIKDLVIPNTVTSLGYNSFNGCSGLISATIPETVTSIGDYAFANCGNLKTIYIANNVNTIGENAFENCSKVETINLPKELQIVKKAMFKSCYSLKSVVIPAKVEFIYQEAFAYCDGLESIKLFSPTPPISYNNTFTNYNAKLSVPAESINAYKSADVWKNFQEITVLSDQEMRINGIQIDDNRVASYFTLDGKQIDTPRKGVNIVRTSNGKTKKVVIK